MAGHATSDAAYEGTNMTTSGNTNTTYRQLGKIVDGPPTDARYNRGNITTPIQLYSGTTSKFINKTYSLYFHNGTSKGESSDGAITFIDQSNFNTNESWHCTASTGRVGFTLSSPLPVSFFARITYQQHADGTKRATSASLSSTATDGTVRSTGWKMNTNQPNGGASTSPTFTLGSGNSILNYYVAVAKDNGFYLNQIDIIPYNQGKRNLYIYFYWECVESIPLTKEANSKYEKDRTYESGVDDKKSQTREFAMDLSLSADTEIEGVMLSLQSNFNTSWSDSHEISLKRSFQETVKVSYEANETGQLMIWQPVLEYKIGADGDEQHTIKMRIGGSYAHTFSKGD